MHQPQQDLTNLITDKTAFQEINPLSGLLRRLYHPDEDCDESDCDELVCLECGAPLETVFGSLPLEVQCTACSTIFILRHLLSSVT